MSTKPILYYAPGSPPCGAVLLVAAEIGIEFDLRPIDIFKNEHKTPEFLKLNPQHTVPVLDDNGVVIIDRHVICTYLADKYSKNDSLFPKDLVARNNVMTRLFLDSGYLFARVRMAIDPVLFFGRDNISQEVTEYIQKAYDNMEIYLTGNPYVCGENMTIADLCCISSMSAANDVAPIDQKIFPNLFAWVERMSALPYYAKCHGEGAKLLKNLLVQKMEENKKK